MRGNGGRGYETPADRRREHEAADTIREAWRIGVWVRPPGATLDFELFDGIDGQGEFKGRTVPFGHYPDVGLFRSKWAALLTAPPPAFVFVGFTDGLRWAYADECHVARAAPFGRTNERDPYDNQPGIFLKNDAFAPIERRP